jgi:hypothetical protein
MQPYIRGQGGESKQLDRQIDRRIGEEGEEGRKGSRVRSGGVEE